MSQTTNRVLMVRPVRFAFNEETAASNAFQQKSKSQEEAERIQRQAVKEFDDYVALLRENGVSVEVVQDTTEPFTPDSIFPNNCFSTHCRGNGDHVLVLYPMCAANRRLERNKLFPSRPLHPSSTPLPFPFHITDLTHWEADGKYLEGTGSLILDRERRIAYACLSPRTCEEVVKDWAKVMDYDYLLFHSEDEQGTPVYHTNVVMHVGTRFAIVCLDSIKDAKEHQQLVTRLEMSGKEIIDITMQQMHQFAGNMLELHNEQGEKLLVMSLTARQSLTAEQLKTLEEDVRIISPDIHAIETAGGGSARCMLAELF